MDSAKKYVGLGIVVSINMALQFLFQWYILVFFGAGTQTDVFFGAMALPQFVLLVLSTSLTMVLVPILTKYEGDDFLQESWNFFLGIGLLFTAIAFIFFITAQWWVKILLPGFKEANFQLALNLSRIQLVAMVFSAMLSVVWAVHSARHNFLLIESTAVVAGVIAFLLLLPAVKMMGIYAAAWISVLKVVLQVLFLIKILGPFRRPSFQSSSFTIAWKKLRPLVAGNLYYKTDTIIDRSLTSMSSSGQLTLLNLAQQLYSMATSIVSRIFVNTILPTLAAKAHAGDWKEFHRSFLKRFWLLLILSAIGYLLILIAGKPVLTMVFAHNNFTPEDIGHIWRLLLLLAGFWFGGVLGSLTSTTFYAKGDTKTPTILSVILFTIYIPIKILSFLHYGITGLVISISTYMLLSLILQLIFLEKNSKPGVQAIK